MICSDQEFLVLYGEAEEAIGRIWGLENGELMVGQGRATAIRIPVGRIYRSIPRDQHEKSWQEWLRARYRYWTANYDLAFAFTDATTENRLLGRTRLDRDLTDRSFAFGQVSAEYDEIQRLSLRTDPAVGLGYRFVAREKLTISGRTGGL
jgi:hypothetical protein